MDDFRLGIVYGEEGTFDRVKGVVSTRETIDKILKRTYEVHCSFIRSKHLS